MVLLIKDLDKENNLHGFGKKIEKLEKFLKELCNLVNGESVNLMIIILHFHIKMDNVQWYLDLMVLFMLDLDKESKLNGYGKKKDKSQFKKLVQ